MKSSPTTMVAGKSLDHDHRRARNSAARFCRILTSRPRRVPTCPISMPHETVRGLFMSEGADHPAPKTRWIAPGARLGTKRRVLAGSGGHRPTRGPREIHAAVTSQRQCRGTCCADNANWLARDPPPALFRSARQLPQLFSPQEPSNDYDPIDGKQDSVIAVANVRDTAFLASLSP